MTRVLLLHGFLGGPSSWDDVHARLGALEIVAPFVPGHGETPAPVGTFGDVVSGLAPLVDDATFIVGYSLGGRLALALAARGLGAGTIVVGAHPGLEDEGERGARLASDEADARALETHGLEAFVDAWEAKPLFATQSPVMRASQRKTRLSHDARRLSACLRALGLGVQPSLWDLPVDAPNVTYLAGALDEKFANVGACFAARSPRVSSHLASGAGHNLLLEAPAFVAERILQRTTASTPRERHP